MMLNEDTDLGDYTPRERKRRATQRRVIELHAAKKAIAPFLKNVHAWQVQAARLQAVCQAGRHKTEAINIEAVRLHQSVELARQQLEQAMASMPEPIARHSCVIDTKRAIETAAAAASRARALSEMNH